MIIDGKPLVPDFPQAPQQISIYQATGILGRLKRPKDNADLMQHCRIDDPVVRVWALSTILLRTNVIEDDVLDASMQAAQYSAHLRSLLMPHLLKSLRFDLVPLIQQFEEQTHAETGRLQGLLNRALVSNDYLAQVGLHEKLFLQTGHLLHVVQARDVAARHLNWKDALKYLLRAIFTHPERLQASVMSLLNLLEGEDARAEFKTIAEVISPNQDIMLTVVYAAAQLQYWNGEYARAINILQESGALDLAQDRLLSRFCNLIALCHEKDGDFPEAAKWFQKQNDATSPEEPTSQHYVEGVQRRAALNIPALPVDENLNHFIMTGFTRSGTTLLENVLSSHPDVVTCEEPQSFHKSLQTAFHLNLTEDPEKSNMALRALFHRTLYYQDLGRYVNKPNPKVIIDKTPMMGGNIKYLEKLMPQKRYIFSIRHPYDVVLSNYKQIYNQIPEMIAFNSIYESCVQYDFVMRQWFDVFAGQDERVFYVVYDELVNDFETVVRGALDHLGVGWSDAVSDFAKVSSNRAVRTPSYAKVRQGLGIGVQTTRQDYDFLFDAQCRKLLDPWVERHGYGI